MTGMIADDRKNLRHVGKIETLPILPIRPRPSQIIGDVYHLWFSSVGKHWDGRETEKSPIVWDFPDKRKLGLTCFLGSISTENMTITGTKDKNQRQMQN